MTHYSSGGYWRLGQALTALWDKDLKQVLQDELFSHLGIPPERWDWLPGKVVHDNRDFYGQYREDQHRGLSLRKRGGHLRQVRLPGAIDRGPRGKKMMQARGTGGEIEFVPS